jgi:hypothetical protein
MFNFVLVCSLSGGVFWVNDLIGFLLNVFITSFLLPHLGWFCVVKTHGCCGRIGYLIWGIIYVVVALTRTGYASSFSVLDTYGGGSVGLWTALLCLANLLAIVPAGYMGFACLQLFQTDPADVLLGNAPARDVTTFDHSRSNVPP